MIDDQTPLRMYNPTFDAHLVTYMMYIHTYTHVYMSSSFWGKVCIYIYISLYLFSICIHALNVIYWNHICTVWIHNIWGWRSLNIWSGSSWQKTKVICQKHVLNPSESNTWRLVGRDFFCILWYHILPTISDCNVLMDTRGTGFLGRWCHPLFLREWPENKFNP